MPPPERPTCPRCGEPLKPLVAPGCQPPWACRGCHRAWWEAELTPEAREAYNPLTDDHHWQSGVHRARENEWELAHMRGVSTHADQLEHLSSDQLAQAREFAHERADPLREAIDRMSTKESD